MRERDVITWPLTTMNLKRCLYCSLYIFEIGFQDTSRQWDSFLRKIRTISRSYLDFVFLSQKLHKCFCLYRCRGDHKSQVGLLTQNLRKSEYYVCK